MKTNIKTKIISGILFFTFFLIFGCEEFVDIRKSNTQRLVESIEDCQALLDNFDQMNISYPSSGEASADDYFLTDPGYLSVPQESRELYVWSPTAIRSSADPYWQNPYRKVYYANVVIETAKKIEVVPANQKQYNNIVGSALFYRSFTFWQLAQLYTKPYSILKPDDTPGIPLRLDPDINYLSERGTVSGTYQRIIDDLKAAANLLPDIPLIVSRPSKPAAYAMLARVYLSIEDYPNALSYANLALQLSNSLIDFNGISKTSSTPFSPRFNVEVIFHSLMNGDALLNPSSNQTFIDPVLVASYQANDLRRQIFFKSVGSNYRFTGNYEPVTSATFFNGLAVDELYLTRAEAYARTGNVLSAMTDLNTLLAKRWATGTYINMTAATADEALAKILDERRKELLMRGLRWSDLRRLNRDPRFAKTVVRTVQGTNYTLPVNDSRYVLFIPQEVINNSQIPQNVR